MAARDSTGATSAMAVSYPQRPVLFRPQDVRGSTTPSWQGGFSQPPLHPPRQALTVPGRASGPCPRTPRALVARQAMSPSHPSAERPVVRGGPSAAPWQRPAVASPLRGASKLPRDPHGHRSAGETRPGAFLPPGPQTIPWRPTVRRLDARQRSAAGPRPGPCHSPWTLDQGSAPPAPGTKVPEEAARRVAVAKHHGPDLALRVRIGPRPLRLRTGVANGCQLTQPISPVPPAQVAVESTRSGVGLSAGRWC
jgi:hypothetical protein